MYGNSNLLGLHNGHTIVGNEWHSYLLEEDEEENTLVAKQNVVEINGYVAHELMALAFLLEYDIGVPIASHADTMSLLQSSSQGKQSTRLALGGSTFIPFDGEELILRNVSKREEDLLGVELPMSKEPCSILTLSPVYADAALSTHTDDDESKAGSEDDLGFMVSFDLRAFHPVDGEIQHRDLIAVEAIADGRTLDVSVEEEKLGRSPARSTGRITERSPAKRVKSRYEGLEPEAESDTIVAGTVEIPVLKLDPSYYGENRDSPAERGGITVSPRLNIPRDKKSLLARALLSKVVAGHVTDEGLLEDHDDKGSILLARVGDKSSFAAQLQKDASFRDLSRGARARLSRFGFDANIMGRGTDYTIIGPTADTNAVISPIDLALETNDGLLGNEVLLTFAGYRTSMSLVPPKAIYVTYQFYTCSPTRTEVMRLSSAEHGGVHALLREEAIDRLEATLAIRHLIDCSLSTPREVEDFVAYLARSWLYVDVWDADALLYMGTAAIPLRRLLRQGGAVVKASLECDVVNTEIYADFSSGIASTTIYDAEGVGGTLVGSLQVLLSNTGYKGKGIRVKLNNDRRVDQDDIPALRNDDYEGLNWRFNHPSNVADSKKSRRPRNIVRARPLSETTPELSGALSSLRSAANEGGRSLTHLRGEETNHTLSYDEVVMLFKRFQGPIKGTVQYRGPLLSLLDVPTWSAGYRRLMEAYHIMEEEGVHMERVSHYFDYNLNTIHTRI